MVGLKLLKRILTHKFWVAYYCFQVGLYWQGIVHDLSKFSWTEFSRSIKYWDDKISSLANERNINGYSETFLHHRGRNPHHYEYWIHSLDDGGIPAELREDWLQWKVGFCKHFGIEPDYVNESPLLKGTKKPFFNLLLDDRAGLQSAYVILKNVLDYADSKSNQQGEE